VQDFLCEIQLHCQSLKLLDTRQETGRELACYFCYKECKADAKNDSYASGVLHCPEARLFGDRGEVMTRSKREKETRSTLSDLEHVLRYEYCMAKNPEGSAGWSIVESRVSS
jgi:hypothetical protein